MDNVLMVLNQNKIAWGLSMLLLNFGSRYVIADLGKFHEMILSHQITKKLIVFAMFFVATRDILTSFILALAYIIIIDGILHEKRKFCILPKAITHKVNSSYNNVSKDDYNKAKSIINMYEQQDSKSVETSDIAKKTLYINYLTNVTLANESTKNTM
jgi:hypothetical protein